MGLSLSEQAGSLRERFVKNPAATPRRWSLEAFESTINGTTYTSQHRKPFFSTPEDPVYVERDGTYYDLDSVIVDEVTTTRPVIRLIRCETTGEPVDPSQLPVGDRRAARNAYFAARARENPDGIPSVYSERGGHVYRDEEAVDTSRLLASDGPAYVSYRRQVYRVETTVEEFHEPVYRATAEPVAESTAEMETVLRAQYVDARFSRTDRSTDARQILRSAQQSMYSESYPYSSGFAEVLRALDKWVYLDGNVGGDDGVDDTSRQMLLYDGVYYEFRLGVYSEPSDS